MSDELKTEYELNGDLDWVAERAAADAAVAREAPLIWEKLNRALEVNIESYQKHYRWGPWQVDIAPSKEKPGKAVTITMTCRSGSVVADARLIVVEFDPSIPTIQFSGTDVFLPKAFAFGQRPEGEVSLFATGEPLTVREASRAILEKALFEPPKPRS
jgi:hypothetical protein